MPACAHCKKEFASEQALAQHASAVHGSAHAKPHGTPALVKIAKGRGRALWIAFAFIVIIGLGYGVSANGLLGSGPDQGFVPPNAVVHWHAYPTVFICGQERELLSPLDPAGHIGTELLHVHAPPERSFHIEGYVGSADDIRLGRFMDAIGVPFSADRVFEATDAADACKDGKDNRVTMKVDGQSSELFQDLVLRDGMKLEIRYE